MKKNATVLQVFEQAMQLCDNKKELSELAQCFVIMGMAMIRGVEGKKFAEGFLHGEVTNENPITIKPEYKN